LNQRRKGRNQRIYLGNGEYALGLCLFFHYSAPEQGPIN
jgi:hypothetical protein